MLMHLHSSSIDEASRGGSAHAAISNLLMAHDAQKHHLSVDQGAKRLLATSMDPRARGALQSILNTASDINGLRKRLPMYAELGVGNAFDGRMETRGDQNVICADLLHFADFERAGRTVLLAEDDTDAVIYEALARAGLAARGDRMTIAYQLRGGGGSNIADAYGRLVREGQMVLAIVDSDRSFPEDSIGGTARGLREAVRRIGGQVVDLGGLHDISGTPALFSGLILHARMLENLPPFEIYEEALAPHAKTPSAPELLIQIRNRLSAKATTQNWHWYVDFKEGLRRCDIDEMSAQAQAYWLPLCETLGRATCQEPGCKATNRCECWVFIKPGDKVAEAVARWLLADASKPAYLARRWGLSAGSADPCMRRLVDWLVCFGIAPKAPRRST